MATGPNTATLVSFSTLVFKPQARKKFRGIAGLADGIKTQGLLDPIIVQPQGNKWLIVDGERRYRAIALLRTEAANNKRSLPFENVAVTEFRAELAKREAGSGITNQLETGLAQLAANVNRMDLEGWELGLALVPFDKAKIKNKDIALRVNKDPGYLSRCIQIGRGLKPKTVVALTKAQDAIPVAKLLEIVKANKGEKDQLAAVADHFAGKKAPKSKTTRGKAMTIGEVKLRARGADLWLIKCGVPVKVSNAAIAFIVGDALTLPRKAPKGKAAKRKAPKRKAAKRKGPPKKRKPFSAPKRKASKRKAAKRSKRGARR